MLSDAGAATGASALPAYVQKLPAIEQAIWANAYRDMHARPGSNAALAFKAANVAVKRAKGYYLDSWDVEERQIDQATAGYTPFGANDSKGCANCQFFISPDSCVVVRGDISPTGMSKFYTPVVTYEMQPIPVTIVKEEGAPNVIARFAERVKSMFKSTPAELQPFRIEKSADGYRVFTIFSNNFQDTQQEIIKESAHREYVQWADQTKLYPEFHLWHAGPGSRFGQADFVDYVDGFMVASGMVDAGKEAIAEELMARQKELATSYGFFGVEERGSVPLAYDLYRAFEISPLPIGAEANKWTAFNLAHKEFLMPFSDSKKAWLKDVAKVSDAAIAEMETGLANASASLKASGINFKEESITGTAPVVPATEADAAAVTAASAATGEGNTILVSAVAELTGAVAGLAGLIKTQGASFTKEIGEIKAQQAKTKEQIQEETLTARIAQSGGGFRASESGAAPVTKEGDPATTAKSQDYDWFNSQVMGPILNPPQVAQPVQTAPQNNGAK